MSVSWCKAHETLACGWIVIKVYVPRPIVVSQSPIPLRRISGMLYGLSRGFHYGSMPPPMMGGIAMQYPYVGFVGGLLFTLPYCLGCHPDTTLPPQETPFYSTLPYHPTSRCSFRGRLKTKSAFCGQPSARIWAGFNWEAVLWGHKLTVIKCCCLNRTHTLCDVFTLPTFWGGCRLMGWFLTTLGLNN